MCVLCCISRVMCEVHQMDVPMILFAPMKWRE